MTLSDHRGERGTGHASPSPTIVRTPSNLSSVDTHPQAEPINSSQTYLLLLSKERPALPQGRSRCAMARPRKHLGTWADATGTIESRNALYSAASADYGCDFRYQHIHHTVLIQLDAICPQPAPSPRKLPVEFLERAMTTCPTAVPYNSDNVPLPAEQVFPVSVVPFALWVSGRHLTRAIFWPTMTFRDGLAWRSPACRIWVQL